MDLIKKLTGKNPQEYVAVAKSLVDNADINLFSELVKQDDFLFDFVKNNVSERIKNACNVENYRNLLKFFVYYSPSYDSMFGEVLWNFGKEDIFDEIIEILEKGSDEQKAYSLKYLVKLPKDKLVPHLSKIRELSKSDFEPLSANAICVLSKLNDDISKNEAYDKLQSDDEFEQYEGVKFLVNFGDASAVKQIIEVMKKSSLSENIASELLYLIPIEDIMNINKEDGLLVLCNIITSIPEIMPISSVLDYNLYENLERISKNINSQEAIVLRLAQDKFEELTANEEYLFDADKNTKEEVFAINDLLKSINKRNLENLLYEELYEDSAFVFYALDYINDEDALTSLLDSTNQTLLLKVLTILKEKTLLNNNHKELALKNISNKEIKQIVEVL